MSVDLAELLDAVDSHARAAGGLGGTQRHEPEGAPPGKGLRLAVWLQRIDPSRRSSGLHVTAGRVELAVRLYAQLTTDTLDRVDLDLAAAADRLFRAYIGDFTLGGVVMNVDVLGAAGQGLTGAAGYQTIEGETFRVFSISLPIILSDLWEQAP